MIVTITGILKHKLPDQIIIDVGGLGYLCRITANTFDTLPALGQTVFLHTHFHVTDSSQELYAFEQISERSMFLLLIGVSGIGPKTAIQLLSAVTPEEFRNRIVAGEVGMLTALPGIGPKTARRIIVELKDKFVKLSENDLPLEDQAITDSAAREAVDALKALGYRNNEAQNAVRTVVKETPDLELQQIIKTALGKLR